MNTKYHEFKSFLSKGMSNKNSFLFLILVLFSACQSEVAEEKSTLEPLAYTLYTDSLELFVEYKPLVVGETSKFAAHFTKLGENFTALTEATISVSFISGKKGIRNAIDSCSSPGIFRLALKPKTSGQGKLVFDITAKGFKDRIVIENVIVYPDEATALKHQETESPSTDIVYLKEQAWKVEFANAPIKKQNFNEIIKTSGQLLSAPGDEMMLVAKASGIVQFMGSNIIEGSAVSQGESLFTITGGDLSEGNVDANFKQAKTSYQKAKIDFERASDLIKEKLITTKEFQETKLRYESAENTYNQLSKNYSSGGKKCVAPMSGFIKNVLVKEGEYVQAGTPLALVSKNKKLLLQASVSQKYFSKLSTIFEANFSLSSENNKTFNTKKLNGSIVSFGKSTSLNVPFIPITFEIDNIGDLIPGAMAEVYLKSAPISDALIVPVSALVEEQGFFYVYVQVGGESFQKREVKLGANDGVNVQILQGVTENERVVTKGAYQIKLATASGAMPAHGHEH